MAEAMAVLAAWYTGVFAWWQVPLLLGVIGLVIFLRWYRRRQV